MDMECFKEVKFKYRVKFANNIGRMKIKDINLAFEIKKPTKSPLLNTAGILATPLIFL